MALGAGMLTMPTAETERQSTKSILGAPVRRRPAAAARRRNRRFGIALACIAVLVFATAVAVAILVNYLERHHALPKF